MKRLNHILMFLVATAVLLTGCNNGIEEPDVPVTPTIVTLELSDADLVFDAEGGQKTFMITSNAEWTITNESDWCTTDVASGNGDRTVTVTVAPSAETEDRNLNLSIRAGEQTGILTVTEKHGNALILAKDKFDLSQDGGNVSIDVKSDVDEVIVPAEYQSWITLAPDTRAAQIKRYVFIILEKEGKEGRRGYIIFKSGERSDTVFIFQAPEKRLILSEDTCHVSGEGGELTVELKTNMLYDVTIPSTAASWVSQITERSFRSDRLKLHIEATTVDRNAEIVIKNRYGNETDTLYIRQTSTPSPKEDITSEFDPDFAKVLQEKGYISDATHITLEEVRNIDFLDVSGTDEDWEAGKGLTSLKGIEYFESLIHLECYANQLTTLDVSKNTELDTLACAENQLTTLDVSKNTKLTYLWCDDNQLSTLDVSKNTKLTFLVCEANQLTSLDISKNTELDTLACDDNQLTTLDVSKNTELTYLDCYENQLTSLDVSQNTKLTELDCDNNQLTSLDVSQNTKLTDLRCDNNQLTSLDVSKNTRLTYLDCSDNQLTTLNVSKNTELTDLQCYGNQLTSLDVSNNTKLTYLGCWRNPGNGTTFPVTVWKGYENTLNIQISWEYEGQTITTNIQVVE